MSTRKPGTHPAFNLFNILYFPLNQPVDIHPLLEQFSRNESGKMIAVLTKIFGTANLDPAEDVVQDALLEANSQWQIKGIPDNPSAWLFRVAKNKALNIVNREKYKRQYSADTSHFLQSAWTAEPDHPSPHYVKGQCVCTAGPDAVERFQI
jgi:DNA-directed RNA polymerase specialized sigma24 family protein